MRYVMYGGEMVPEHTVLGPMTHKQLLVARQALADAAIHFALVKQDEPCVSYRYAQALERAIQAMDDYAEASIRCGLTTEGV